MWPESGALRPAMQSSNVVLPAPDAPKRMVKPDWTWNATSSLNRCCANCLPNSAWRQGPGWPSISSGFYWYDPCFAIHAIHEGEQDEADDQQDQGRLICAGIVRGLNTVINVDRHGARDAG